MKNEKLIKMCEAIGSGKFHRPPLAGPLRDYYADAEEVDLEVTLEVPIIIIPRKDGKRIQVEFRTDPGLDFSLAFSEALQRKAGEMDLKLTGIPQRLFVAKQQRFGANVEE